MLLLSIIRAELSQCILAIVWDSALAGSPIVDSLSRLPNVKQVVGDGEVGKILWWEAKQCRAYFLLVSDPSSLIYQAEYAAQEDWDYSGRLVIVGLSRSHIDTLITTMKGRKTEHILGIVQTKSLVTRDLISKHNFTQPLFPDKTKNLHGSTLNVVTFEFPPEIMYRRDKEGNLVSRYGGNVRLVETMAKIFNFTVCFIEPAKGL
ncbi:hypothetical protein O3P69_004672 [Scylla paramamosain]|uniref:Uncharacterized protein n=1 Tax=Scylla paramamosain TaxID=85552 RepID=A0AAW0UAK7_SCYPA